MTWKHAPSFNVTIHMAGDIREASHFIQRYAAERGMCVSIAPQRFIYTGGAEDGFAIGFINYPRFPKEWSAITLDAKRLAEALMLHLGQHSFSIVTPEETSWFSRRPERTPI